MRQALLSLFSLLDSLGLEIPSWPQSSPQGHRAGTGTLGFLVFFFLQKTIFRMKEAADGGVCSSQTKIKKGAPNNSVLAGKGYF